jgi:hypothetical protein
MNLIRYKCATYVWKGARPTSRHMGPHNRIDLTSLSCHISCKWSVCIAGNTAAIASTCVFPSESVIHVCITAITQVTVGHDSGTFRQRELGRAGIDTDPTRPSASADINFRGVWCFMSVGCVKIVPNFVHELNGRRTIRRSKGIRDVFLSDITYHHHIPNDGITHTPITPIQTAAQSKAVVCSTKDAHVGDAAAQALAKKRVVHIRLDPLWRCVMKWATIGSGKYGTHYR